MGEKGKKATWIPIEEPDERRENDTSPANEDFEDGSAEENMHYAHIYGDESDYRDFRGIDAYILMTACVAMLAAMVAGVAAVVYGGIRLGIWLYRKKFS